MTTTTPKITKKLKPEVKAKWLEALRSGNYQQGRHQLHSITFDEGENGDSYCCLGVLCEIAKAEGVIKNYTPDKGHTPNKVADWAGISRFDVRQKTGNSVQAFLAKLNDGKWSAETFDYVDKMSFEEIADWIEENL